MTRLRAGPFELGVGITLLVASTFFLAATLGALALGENGVEIGIGPIVLYRFTHQPGLTELHVGPAVFLAALLAGTGRAMQARHR